MNAVNASKDIGFTTLPNVKSLDGNVVSGNERSQSFADFFEQKVRNIVRNTVVDAEVYNGERIILADDEMFMSRQDITTIPCEYYLS